MKIYKEGMSEPYSFLIIDTILPANNSLSFRKKSMNTLIKIAVTDQPKNLDNKIKTNQAQLYLDRLVAKISALSSGELEKSEYLTGDLGFCIKYC